MKISELTALLQKAAQVAGDVEVALHDVTDTVDHVLHGFQVNVPAAAGAPTTVALVHGPAESAPQPPEPQPEPGPGTGEASAA